MKKYLQIYKKLKAEILSGEILPNAKLPSKRVTADIFGCSIITVERAYGMLVEEGYITSKERSGYFVENIDFLPKGSVSDYRIGSFLTEPTVKPDQDFEYSNYFKTVRKVISEKSEELFIKAPNEGCAVLRNAISRYLSRYRGMSAKPKNIIIGSGAEQLYENVVKILGREKIFGIESPCYEKINLVYGSEGVTLSPLKMGKDGILSSELKNKKFDVLHITPFSSFPSGITATAKKRYEYLKIAKEKGIFIVEDDFASEFFKPGNPIESLYATCVDDSVIYINTFSKSLSPSMRIGYMILPERLLKTYQEKLGKFSCSVPVLEQYILAEFIDSGNFERHLNKERKKMKNKKIKTNQFFHQI
ncbi:MAG: PLP-dependent aminotransferase family protein [Clostridia bacterium]|nr:PLP-dependent aminotransferase family protein [Clostridia bacterium]